MNLSLKRLLTKDVKVVSKTRKKYENLEIEEIIYDLTDDEKVCPKCESELHHMKYDIRKEFKYIPATLKIVHHKKQVCACRNCDTHGEDGTIIALRCQIQYYQVL